METRDVDPVLGQWERAADRRRQELERELTRTERQEIFGQITRDDFETPRFFFFTQPKAAIELTPDDVESLLSNRSSDLWEEAEDELRAIGNADPSDIEVEERIEQKLLDLGVNLER